ncbi:glycine cleavage T C-terminal barrel domain-containing protein [Amycolatopsis sp. NPDC059090]|uniref:glycine cleavage T C-terminal barrel domain-containing protein n=1 Tax=unclassified Amycolatopsis TaxID=2618356 RepID=UPI00366F4064
MGLRNPLAQPGVVWMLIAPEDLTTAARALHLRRTDPGGLFERTAERFGPVTAWCSLADNVIGAANWERLTLAEQYEAVNERAGAFIASAMVYLRISGPGAGAVLDRLTPRAVSDMPIGTARFVLFTTQAGAIDDEAVVLRLGPEAFLLSCGGGKRPGWLDAATRLHPGVAVEEGTHGSFNIKGPGRLETVLRIINNLDSEVVANLAPFGHCAIRSPEGNPIRVVRTIIGYEVWASPDVLGRMWQRVLDDYPRTVPCGWDLLNTYRMECTDIAFGLYPVDLHSGITLKEAGYGWMTRAGADHDYIGKSPLLDDSGPRLRLRGLEAAGEVPVPAIGEEITDESGNFRGHVTSAAHSPKLNRPLAFGHLHPGLRPGASVVIDGTEWIVRTLPILACPTRGDQVDHGRALVPATEPSLLHPPVPRDHDEQAVVDTL